MTVFLSSNPSELHKIKKAANLAVYNLFYFKKW